LQHTTYKCCCSWLAGWLSFHIEVYWRLVRHAAMLADAATNTLLEQSFLQCERTVKQVMCLHAWSPTVSTPQTRKTYTS
jgi:hypothetical protein